MTKCHVTEDRQNGVNGLGGARICERWPLGRGEYEDRGMTAIAPWVDLLRKLCTI